MLSCAGADVIPELIICCLPYIHDFSIYSCFNVYPKTRIETKRQEV